MGIVRRLPEVNFSVRMTGVLYERLDKAAKKAGTSKAGYVRRLLYAALENGTRTAGKRVPRK
jgi:predicted DNA-binding protein